MENGKDVESKIEVETLEINNVEKDKNITKDIPSSFFKPIDEIQEQQQTLFQNYEGEKKSFDSSIDLNNEIRKLEKKLNKKRLYLPFSFIIILIIVINMIWFLGVKFLIVPKYEQYVKQNEEIKQSYNSLKRRVDALVGE